MNYSNYFSETWALHQQAAVYLPHSNPTFENPPFEAAAFRVLITRLSPFRDVDRSTPHLFLYQAARNAAPDAYIDLAFFPPAYDRERFRVAGVPLLFGTQSFRSADNFDLVLVSNAYTLELINLPYLLLNSDIPVLASLRDERWPIFVLGGSNALAAQALLTPEGDAVPDALFFGEGEGEVERLVALLRERAGEPKSERLRHAAQLVKGLWVAGGDLCQRVKKSIHPAPGEKELVVEYPRLNSAEAGTARLQITYGCPAFCSFCFEGYDRKPYREVPREAILEAARRIKAEQGAETLELYSFNFNTHSDILLLLLDLNRLFSRVGIKSQRVDFLYTTPGLIQAEVMADKRSFTLGIEGISRRMRAFLRKSLKSEAIEGVLATLMREKIREVKLFYILTGHETEADIEEFRSFLLDLKALRYRTNPGIRIIFSMGLLVRMPFTPLRYDHLFLDEEAWRQIVGPIKSACETNGFEFRVATSWEEYAASQVLAMGGSWLHEPLLTLAGEGHCYDGGLTSGYWEGLRTWLEAAGFWNEDFLGEKGPEYAFPLDFVANGIGDDFFYCRYEEARSGVDEGYCLGVEGLPGRCMTCGACALPEQRQAILQHKMVQAESRDYWKRLPALMKTKWRLQPVYARLRLPPVVTGVEPAWFNSWALHYLLRTYPELLENLLAAQESLLTVRENAGRFANFYGETIFALQAWERDALIWQLAAAEGESEAGVVDLIEDFTPGSFSRLRLSLTLPVRHFPAAGQRLRDYLRELYVPANIRGVGEGYVFDLPQKALKKKVLFEGRYVEDDEHFEASLVLGPKFDLLGFLRSFEEPKRYREASIEIREVIL
ncbi:MAG: radical SAM protein [Anaerolineales bacterium]